MTKTRLPPHIITNNAPPKGYRKPRRRQRPAIATELTDLSRFLWIGIRAARRRRSPATSFCPCCRWSRSSSSSTFLLIRPQQKRAKAEGDDGRAARGQRWSPPAAWSAKSRLDSTSNHVTLTQGQRRAEIQLPAQFGHGTLPKGSLKQSNGSAWRCAPLQRPAPRATCAARPKRTINPSPQDRSRIAIPVEIPHRDRRS